MDLVIAVTVADVLDGNVVVTSPEEWYLFIGFIIAKHTVSNLLSLLECVHPMLNSCLLASHPQWE